MNITVRIKRTTRRNELVDLYRNLDEIIAGGLRPQQSEVKEMAVKGIKAELA